MAEAAGVGFEIRTVGLPMEDAYRDILQRSDMLNIVLIGNFNVGKSSLVNSMMGETVAPVAEEMKPRTDKVEYYEFKPEGLENTIVRVYDTPGLRDGKKKEKEYLRQIKKKSPHFHLVIYCTKLGEPVRPDEQKALKLFVEYFGAEIMQNHMIVALTFANQVLPHNDTPKDVYFRKKVQEKTQSVQEFLQTIKKCKNYDLQKAYPVGADKTRKLPTVEDWLNEFWIGCIEICASEGKGAAVKIASRSDKFLIHAWKNYPRLHPILEKFLSKERLENIKRIATADTDTGPAQ